MTKFNFFCIGTQKAGTTTLHEILNQHPNLCLPEKKETHFFSNEDLFAQGKSFYLDFFNNIDNFDFFGEIDPEYSYFTESAERIYDMFGGVKIIFILRNPVERAFSHYLMTKRRGLEELSFERAMDIEETRLLNKADKMHYSYQSRGLYLNQLLTFEKIFGKKNIKVILFEDFIKHTDDYISEISNFIGLPAFNFDANKKSNPASSPRFKIIQKLIYKDNKTKKLIGKLFGSKDRKRKIAQYLEGINLKKSKKEKLSHELRTKIYKKYYEKEISQLELKLDLNLDIWKH